MKCTKEILEAAVRDAHTMADVMRNLGERPTGGLHAHLRRRIDYFEIDTSHFIGSAHGKGRSGYRKLPPEEVLVEYPQGSNRQPSGLLRRALAESGVRYRCSSCGIDQWQGKPLTLHVDHVNGNYWDCRQRNLRFICPNCHALTANYRGRSKGRPGIPVLEDGIAVRRFHRRIAVHADGHRAPVPPSEPAPESLTLKQRAERAELAEAVRHSHSVAGVIRHLGHPLPSGGRHMTLKKKISRYGIDTSHFRGQAHNKGKISPHRKAPHQVLIERPSDAPRVGAERLRRALIASGMVYACSSCANPGSWQESPITLHVDHINARYWDCRPGNLRFLCPNCHSQTWTFARRGSRPAKRQV